MRIQDPADRLNGRRRRGFTPRLGGPLDSMLLRTLTVALAFAFGAAGGATAPTRAPAPSVKTYKTSTCGCCIKWVDHLRKSGFEVAVIDLAPADLLQLKAQRRVPPALRTCHTALVGDYVVEGHVPADAVQRLLAERRAVAGIGVAGMPIGSPGMEGSRNDPYDVVAFSADGTTAVFAKK